MLEQLPEVRAPVGIGHARQQRGCSAGPVGSISGSLAALAGRPKRWARGLPPGARWSCCNQREHLRLSAEHFKRESFEAFGAANDQPVSGRPEFQACLTCLLQ